MLISDSRRLPPLAALCAFEAAARHVSFKRAAAELAVTPTAISHQVRALEAHVGLSLFERQVRKVVLTEAGAQLYPVLRDGLDAFAAALARLANARTRNRVTISATSAFTARWLVPRLAAFRERHGDIDLHLHASDEIVDLRGDSRGDGVDLAIRYGPGPYPGLAAEAMFADRFAPVSHPRLKITSLADLDSVPLIHFRWNPTHPLNPTWARWHEIVGRPASRLGHLYLSDEGHAALAAVAGQGIGLLSLVLVEEELAAGLLVQPFGPTLEGHAYHLVSSPDRRPSASVTAVADWLRETMRAKLPRADAGVA